MDSQEIDEFFNTCDVKCSQLDFSDVPFSPGSQDSLSNIELFDFNAAAPNLDLPGLSNNDKSHHLFAHNMESKDVQYQLFVSFESQVAPVTKSAAWTYSEQLKRLYVNMGLPCPIKIKLEPKPLQDFKLRCFLQYTDAAYIKDPVMQCANHSIKESDFIVQGHVLRSSEIGVRHEKDECTKRCSVLFSYDAIQDGVDKDMFVFEFKCLTTCLGRRTTKLVFEMEHHSKILCSHAVDLRICSCPGRDRKHDEELLRNQGVSRQKIKREMIKDISSGPTKRQHGEDDVFIIKVRGRSNYELLEALRQKLEKADGYDQNFDRVYKTEVRQVSEPVKEQLRASQQSHSSSSSRSQRTVHHNSQLSEKGHSTAGKSLKTRLSMPVTNLNPNV